MRFSEFFIRATGWPPYPYQHRLSETGDLLLLPKQFNAATTGRPTPGSGFATSARTSSPGACDPQAYEENAGFLAFIKSSGLPFKAHDEFKSADIDVRSVVRRDREEGLEPQRSPRAG